jgi:antitoxin YefM
MAQAPAKKRARTSVGRAPLAMAEARKQLPKLADTLEKHPEIGAVKITRHGKPVLAVLSWDLYESVVETMEIMSDPEMMAAFRQGVREMEEGNGIPWDQVKKELGF